MSVLFKNCKRCRIGLDSDGDGNCPVCVRLTNSEVLRMMPRTDYERELESLVSRFKDATMNMNGENIAAAHEAAEKLGL